MSKKLIYPITFLSFVLLFFVLSNASVNAVIYPFAIAMTFALVWSGQKIWIVAPSFICARLLFDFSIESLIISLTVVICLFVPFFFHMVSKKKTKLWGQIVLLIISQLINLAYIYNNIEKMIYLAITIILSVLFFLACVKILNSFRSKGWIYRFTNLEIICASVVLLSIVSGISIFAIGKFEFVKLVISLLLKTEYFK